jgi:hypothetical protein
LFPRYIETYAGTLKKNLAMMAKCNIDIFYMPLRLKDAIRRLADTKKNLLFTSLCVPSCPRDLVATKFCKISIEFDPAINAIVI